MALRANRRDAEHFVAALTGDVDTAVTFQVFEDSEPPPGCAPMVDVLYGSLKERWARLEFLNAHGSGVFITINACDGDGRKAQNVTALRALFVDDDDGHLTEDSNLLTAMPPSMSVQSKRGRHCYWLLRPGEALERFKPAQQALAKHLGTDTKICDLPRVMRLPGLVHAKDPKSPFLVRLVDVNDLRYTVDEVLGGFGLTIATRPSRAPASQARRPSAAARTKVSDLLTIFRQLRITKWAIANPDALSREAWRGLATNIASIVADVPEAHADGEALFHEVSEGYATYSPDETTKVFQDALKSAKTHGPMLFETLMDQGVPESVCQHRGLAKAPVALARLLLARRTARPGTR